MTPSQIRSLRKSLRMSQQAFATMLHVGIATVNRWERGVSDPKEEHVARLLKLQRRAA